MIYNLIVVYSKDLRHVLFCKRKKDPYQGLYNFVGGKKEENETDLEGAYRELFEETHIGKDNIDLVHLMNFDYCLDSTVVQVFVGALKEDQEVYGDENALCWLDHDHDFFDPCVFAGEGNIGHIFEHIRISKERIFGTSV